MSHVEQQLRRRTVRTFLQKPQAPQPATLVNSTIPSRPLLTQSRDMDAILHLPRTIRSQAVPQLLQRNAEELNAGLTNTASPHFGHDFSRMLVSPPTAGTIQPKLAINTAGDEYEQEADGVAEQ